MGGERIHGGILCHLDARLMLTSSTQSSGTLYVLKNVDVKLTFKLREQRDTAFTKAGQGARSTLLSSLVSSKPSVLIAELFCALDSPPPLRSVLEVHRPSIGTQYFLNSSGTLTRQCLFFSPLAVGEGGVIAFVTSDGTPRAQGKRAIILIYKQVGNLFSHALKNLCAIGAGCAD